MMLLSFHIVAIGVLAGVIGNIAYQMGKKEGIRLAVHEFESQQSSSEESPPVT